MHRSIKLLAAALAMAVLSLTPACTRTPPEVVLSGPTMGTAYAVRVVGSIDERRLAAVIDEVLARVDRTLSGYRSDSEIARFNAAGTTQWVAVSADLVRVTAAALATSRASGGAFDVTVAPLVAAWGFGVTGEPPSPPDEQALAVLREHVGYSKLHVRAEPPALRKDDRRLEVDLNGIAPGFAVDLIAERLLAMRIERFLIDIGGEVRAHGLNAQGEPWRVAVERPAEGPQRPQAIVRLADAAVATSGEYRRYYVRDGRRYSHTIDPRTARPVEHQLGSVAVIAANAAEADAWATALNVLGTAEGHALAERLGLAAMFTEAGGTRVHVTPGFSAHVSQQSLPAR